MTDYREAKTNVSQRRRRRVKDTGLTFLYFLLIYYYIQPKKRETNQKTETKKEQRRGAICYDFKVIRDLVVRRRWGHLRVQVSAKKSVSGATAEKGT